MLDLLHIENIAIIEQADIAFRPGFNALTGETGAGKSIVIDAIGAIIGERTSGHGLDHHDVLGGVIGEHALLEYIAQLAAVDGGRAFKILSGDRQHDALFNGIFPLVKAA